ncbi:LCP family protein [Bacillus cereus group sp. BfR-BA-01380]|uniref:LCP family protein n=1 Tax=Bacillus cereus group sp. BfR-BA-01380 TaxID=2920324 RepID=UPI001F565122|nr:LCP family protein [Bacillus cereus group sp. BfR-BA-01380]
MKKGKKIWKIIGFSLLAILIIAVGGGAYAYTQLQPKNHFKNVPVVNANSNKKVDSSQDTKAQNGAFNILLIGSDERKGQNVGHSDSMMIVHVDLNKKEYHAMSIPRDTRVHLDGYGYTKLTSVQYIKQATEGQQKGVDAAIQAITELTGVNINYYVETNYQGLQGMVDAIGGIEMNVPFDVKLTHPWYQENKNKVINAGTHSVDGKMVTEIVHERYSLKNGEYDRQKLQEEALVGIAKKALQPENITKLPGFVKQIPNFLIASNMTTTDMLSLGMAAKDFDPKKQLQYHQIGGEWKTMYDDVLKNNNDELIMNKEQLKQVVSQYFTN